MPGYIYRGTEFDTPEPAPKPRKRPTRPRIKRAAPPTPKPPRIRTPSPCGTTGAYSRHQRLNEPMDDACRQANIDYCQKRRDAQREAKKVYG